MYSLDSIELFKKNAIDVLVIIFYVLFSIFVVLLH